MKKLLLAIAIGLTSLSYGQTFNGVYIGGSLDKAINSFKAKGYSITKFNDYGVEMKGKLGFDQVELYIFVTPKSKQVFKVVAYLPEHESWTSLKGQYNRYKEALINKYGGSDDGTEEFESPYYEGDGYELNAFTLGKATYNTLWLRRENLNLAIEISQFKQVKLTYENQQNIELKRNEMNELQMRNL